MKKGALLHSNKLKYAPLAVAIAVYSGLPVQAIDFQKGEISGNWDTTLTFGESWRGSGQDRSLIGRAADPLSATGAPLTGSGASVTGTGFSENSDDGNQNYANGRISNTLRFTTELEVNYKNYGFFSRFNGFKDMANEGAGERTELTHGANRLVTSNVNIQDFYLWGQFDVAGMPAEIRVGEQVISWGESTFIQNGINVTNPFDVSRLRTPGSEVKDALVPVGMVFASIAPTDTISLEAYYQYDYERTIIEPPGSFFSTNDFVGDGGNKVMLGFGDVSDRGINFGGLLPLINADLASPLASSVGNPTGYVENFNAVFRTDDNRPDEGGEFGVSLRYFAEWLNDTEFGIYAINYHSRVPLISAVAGTAAGVGNAIGAAVAMGGDAVLQGAMAGAGLNVAATISGIATDQYVQTARYTIEYPEDIQLYGMSFNTQLGGIALQGEYSFKNNAPLQIDDIELLIAALCPIAALNPAIGLNQVDPGCASTGTDQKISGFIERDISQIQFTASKVFGPTFKADTAFLIGEVGVTHVHGMPSKDVLRLNGAGTFTSGNTFHAGATGLHAGKAAESADHFADDTSWGYRLAGVLVYNNVLGAINVKPRFAWSHDVSGITPGPGGNFLEGRKAATVGVGVDYQNEWQADFSYTNFFGAGRYNLLNDRDFFAFNVKYSF